MAEIDPRDLNPDLQKYRLLEAFKTPTVQMSIHSDLEIITWSAITAAQAIICQPVYDLLGEYGPKYDVEKHQCKVRDDKGELLPGVIIPPGFRSQIKMFEHLNYIRPALDGRLMQDYKEMYGGAVLPPAMLTPGSPFLFPTPEQRQPGVLDRLLKRNQGPNTPK